MQHYTVLIMTVGGAVATACFAAWLILAVSKSHRRAAGKEAGGAAAAASTCVDVEAGVVGEGRLDEPLLQQEAGHGEECDGQCALGEEAAA